MHDEKALPFFGGPRLTAWLARGENLPLGIFGAIALPNRTPAAADAAFDPARRRVA